MQNHPDQVTKEDATLLKSREARAIGRSQPSKDSVSSDAQRLASANERDTGVKHLSISPENQSKFAKEQNFQDAATVLGPKIYQEPESITLEDSKLLHSLEQKARNHTEKGGIAAQAQKLASENADKTTPTKGPASESATNSDEADKIASEDATKTAPEAEINASLSKPDKPDGGPNRGPIPPHSGHKFTEEKLRQFQSASTDILAKISNDPDHVTAQDANTIHSLEQKAHGHTEKGGITSQVQRLAIVNEGKSGKTAADA